MSILCNYYNYQYQYINFSFSILVIRWQISDVFCYYYNMFILTANQSGYDILLGKCHSMSDVLMKALKGLIKRYWWCPCPMYVGQKDCNFTLVIAGNRGSGLEWGGSELHSAVHRSVVRPGQPGGPHAQLPVHGPGLQSQQWGVQQVLPSHFLHHSSPG